VLPKRKGLGGEVQALEELLFFSGPGHRLFYVVTPVSTHCVEVVIELGAEEETDGGAELMAFLLALLLCPATLVFGQLASGLELGI
jgi:hypothetical protein